MLTYHVLGWAGRFEAERAALNTQTNVWLVLLLPVAPGQMRGNKTLRGSCVQEVVRSEYGEYVQNIVLFWNFIKLGAFLKCFSC